MHVCVCVCVRACMCACVCVSKPACFVVVVPSNTETLKEPGEMLNTCNYFPANMHHIRIPNTYVVFKLLLVHIYMDIQRSHVCMYF